MFIATAGLFALAVLVQFFLAGEAALLAPDLWPVHMAWIHGFQWISVVLPITAYLADRRIGFALLNCLPIFIIGLQYWLIHFAINHGLPPLAGFHAAGGVLLFGFLIFVIQEWRYKICPNNAHADRV